MKIIVDTIPEYSYDCIFCGNKFYSVCSISECQCELEKREECPYLMTIDDYLSKVKHNEDY